MPTYEHTCHNPECKNEWEDIYSIKTDPPKVCPKCNQETAQRVISGGSGKGIVNLTGQDLTDKLKSDASQIQREAARDEKKYANLLGESRYSEMQTKMDRRGR